MKQSGFIFNLFNQKIFWLSLIIITMTGVFSHAQIIQTHRYEKNQKGSDEFFTVISLEEKGIALIREKNKYESGKQKWDVILLDTALQEKFAFDVLVHERHPMIGYEYAGNQLFLLFRTGDNNKSDLELIEININEGRESQRYDIKTDLDFKITHFNKVGNGIVLGGYVSNEPAVLLYTMPDKQMKIVPGFFQKENELVELRVNQNQTFNVVIIDRSDRNDRKLVFRTFDETGKLLLEDLVSIGDDHTLQTAISSSLKREDLLILGSWGERQGKQSTGIFSLPIDPFSDQKINYLSFGQLNHFTDYLSSKRAERIKENAKEAADNGKIPAFSTYVLPYRVEEHKDGYLLLAEVYNPTNPGNSYYSNPYGPNSFNPYYYNPFWPGYYPGMRMYRPYSYGNNVRNAEEIKTQSSVLMAFDPSGKLKWDYSFKLDDVKKLSVEQVSDYYYDGSTVYFFYKDESEIKWKMISQDEGLVKEGVEKVMLDSPQDELRSDRDYEEGIRQWVGNTLYVWGYQTIRNNTHDDRVRDVFFINKVVVE
jgi:hypothetical protein